MKKMRPNELRVCVHLNIELWRLLVNKAAREQRSMSSVARLALERAFAEELEAAREHG